MDKKHQIAENEDNHALIAQHQSGSHPREDAGEAPAGRTKRCEHGLFYGKDFKTWREIRAWADSKGFKNLVARMDLNNRCWNSSGEFGRSQVAICDNIRTAEDEDEAIEVAQVMDEEMEANYGLY